MGAHLNATEKGEWEAAYQKLEKAGTLRGDDDSNLFNQLYISYEGLHDEFQKGLFLDIACLMLGRTEAFARKIWGTRSDFSSFHVESVCKSNCPVMIKFEFICVFINRRNWQFDLKTLQDRCLVTLVKVMSNQKKIHSLNSGGADGRDINLRMLAAGSI